MPATKLHAPTEVKHEKRRVCIGEVKLQTRSVSLTCQANNTLNFFRECLLAQWQCFGELFEVGEGGVGGRRL